MPASRKRFTLVLAAFPLVLLTLPTVPADHAMDDGRRFDHRGGNEWWVEVRFTVPTDWQGDTSFQIMARSEKSASWHDLLLRSWGNYAGSFHVPPGERVQFMALRSGGMSYAYLEKSCFFTHPAGVEQCDPGATDRLGATFRNPSGNSNWQQVFVDSNRPVEVTLIIMSVDGDQWIPMKKASWGGWTASRHAPQGTWIQFRASSGPESVQSACYRWTDAAVVGCPDHAPVAIPSDTRFDHKGGNEWWVEARSSTPYGPPSLVEARDEGGAWVPLTFKSWGNWAGSLHIEPGHKVQFRATDPSGGTPLESCWFTHPAGFGDEGLQVCGGRYPDDA